MKQGEHKRQEDRSKQSCYYNKILGDMITVEASRRLKSALKSIAVKRTKMTERITIAVKRKKMAEVNEEDKETE